MTSRVRNRPSPTPYDYAAAYDRLTAGEVTADEIVAELKRGPSRRLLTCGRPTCSRTFERDRSNIWDYLIGRGIPKVHCSHSCASTREAREANGQSKFAREMKKRRTIQRTAASAVSEAEEILRQTGYSDLARRLRQDVREPLCSN